MHLKQLEKLRLQVARKLRKLREARHLTQAQLARQLGMSQPRLSQIESGSASLTAEQFILVLRTFKTSVSDFVAPADSSSELQVTLARLGAAQLQEDTTSLPSERLERATDAIRETLIDANEPRLITALAPVIVQNLEHIHWQRLAFDLFSAGAGRRFHWLIDNVLDAARAQASDPSIPLSDRRRYRRAERILEDVQQFAPRHENPQQTGVPDVLERDIRTKRSRDEVFARSSEISRRYNIISSLQPADFVEALRGARVVS